MKLVKPLEAGGDKLNATGVEWWSAAEAKTHIGYGDVASSHPFWMRNLLFNSSSLASLERRGSALSDSPLPKKSQTSWCWCKISNFELLTNDSRFYKCSPGHKQNWPHCTWKHEFRMLKANTKFKTNFPARQRKHVRSPTQGVAGGCRNEQYSVYTINDTSLYLEIQNYIQHEYYKIIWGIISSIMSLQVRSSCFAPGLGSLSLLCEESAVIRKAHGAKLN